MSRPIRLAYLVTHPIQYQVPLLRLIAAEPDIELTVFFQSALSIDGYRDPGFGRVVKWDVPLLGGFAHEFLPAIGRRDVVDRHRPLSHGIVTRLSRGQFDVLWVHGYARWFNWVAMLAAKATGIKVLMRDESNEISARRSALKVLSKRVFMRLLAMVVDGFLAIGTLNRLYYIDHGIDPARIDLVPYCVDNGRFAALAQAAAPGREALRRELGLASGRPVILFASKLQARKRPGDLLVAHRKLSEHLPAASRPYLLFVGDGELAGELRAAAGSADDIRFLGFRNQSALPALFDLCDVFVLPSELEPWGLVINEVMAVGRPVVVTSDVGCGPDLVKDGVNGRVVPVGDGNALAGALADILSDPNRAATMGRASVDTMATWSYAQDLAGLRAALHRVNGRTPG